MSVHSATSLDPDVRPDTDAKPRLPSRPQRSAELLRAIEAIYRDRYAIYYRVACGITGDVELGRDVVQEAFARAILRRDDFRGDGPLEGWLWRTVINVAKDQCRGAKGVGLSTELADELPDTSQRQPSDDIPDDIRRRIAALPERQRVALFLRYYVDMSYAEIGETLDIRTGTVSATLNAAHRALRGNLEALRDGGGEAPLPAASPAWRRRKRPAVSLSVCAGPGGRRRPTASG